MATKAPSKPKSQSRRRGSKSAPRASAKKSLPPRLPAKLVRIGNSRGIRLPKSVIEQAGLTENVELSVENGSVIISSSGKKRNPREGWEEQIRAAVAEHGDDTDDWREWQSIPNEFDDKEWTW